MTAVIVARPEPDNERLCAALAQRGYVPVPVPLIRIASKSLDPVERRLVQDLDLFDVVICTSGHAATRVVEEIDRVWPQLPAAPAWLAVGMRTAGILADFGIDAAIPARETSEGLLDHALLARAFEKRCLIVRGEGGRGRLQRTLLSRGARVDALELYVREPVRPTDAMRRSAAGAGLAVATSGELVQLLGAVIPPGARSAMRLIVPSERVAELARGEGYLAEVADGASDEATLDALDAL